MKTQTTILPITPRSRSSEAGDIDLTPGIDRTAAGYCDNPANLLEQV
jgi:hypothetical protein